MLENSSSLMLGDNISYSTAETTNAARDIKISSINLHIFNIF